MPEFRPESGAGARAAIFLVDYRPAAGIRIAPHFHTKDEELELVIREIGKLGEKTKKTF